MTGNRSRRPAAWDIRRAGRSWTGEEFWARLELTPEKFEANEGKLFWDESQRINLLGLLLENVGLDAAVRLGSLEAWEEAIQAVKGHPREVLPREPEYFDEEE